MNQTKFLPVLVTLVASVGSFVLSRVIWPDLPNMPMPMGAQLPLLIAVGIVESLAFGVGVSFIIFAWGFMKGRSVEDWLVFFSAAWLLISWWPHDNLHRITPMGDYWGLIRLEWGFHITLIIAGVIVASQLWKEYMPRAIL